MNQDGRWAKPIRAVVALALFLTTAYPTVLWLEAEKEILILCSMLLPGTLEAQVIRTLDTGNLLRYGRVEGVWPGGDDPFMDVWRKRAGSREVILVQSPWTLGTSRCWLAMERGVVAANSPDSAFLLSRAGAWVATAGLLLLILHHSLLALGAPLGHLAWGGGHRVLPASLRLASALSAGLLVVGLLSVLQKAQLLAVLPWPLLAETFPWILVAVFALGLLANAVSERPWERRLGIPLTLILSLACLAVALGIS